MNPEDRAALDEMIQAGYEDLELARAARKRRDNLQALRCVDCARSYLEIAKGALCTIERKVRR